MVGRGRVIAAEQVALAAEERRPGDVTAIWSNGSMVVVGSWDGEGGGGGYVTEGSPAYTAWL